MMKELSIMRTCAHLIKDMLATHNDSQYHCVCLMKRLTQHKSDFKEKHLHKNFVFHKLATHGEGCEKSQFVAFWCLYQSVSTIIIEGICAKRAYIAFGAHFHFSEKHQAKFSPTDLFAKKKSLSFVWADSILVFEKHVCKLFYILVYNHLLVPLS